MSNYSKTPQPEGIPKWAYADHEVVNGTGQTLMWVHDHRCESAGGTAECCSGDLDCTVRYMDWREMEALAWYLLEQSARARWMQLREACSSG